MTRKTWTILFALAGIGLWASCRSQPVTPSSPGTMANPASLYCEQHGNQLKIVTAVDGSQSGMCIFPDGSRCDEWAYYRGQCGPRAQGQATPGPTGAPLRPAGEPGWWTYAQPVYGFSIQLPGDWTAEEASAGDALLGGHLLNLHPKSTAEKENIRMTFCRAGEGTLLWPTGVGQGDFASQGTLDVAGQPVQRVLLVCPTGEVTSIWYQGGPVAPNITRGDLEFAFIFSATPTHCEAGYSLSGKVQQVGEAIIASLKLP